MAVINIVNSQENTTSIIRNIINNINKNEECCINFEKGIYHFYEEDSFVDNVGISNNASGTKKIVFLLKNLKNITIDGNGSEFVFHGHIYPFIIRDCENIRLCNFSIDYSSGVHGLGKVIESNLEYFDLEMSKETDYYVDDGHLIFGDENDSLSTKNLKITVGEYNYSKKRTEDNTWLFYMKVGEPSYEIVNPAVRIMETDATSIGDRIVRFTFRENSLKETFKIGNGLVLHYHSREYGIIFAENTNMIHIDNVNIYRGVGMGIIVQRCSDVFVSGLKIESKEGRDEAVSITADGIHSVNCSGKLEVIDSVINKTFDDPVNIHGVYTIVDKIISKDTFVVKLMHEDQYHVKYYYPSDVLNILDSESLEEKGIVKVCESGFYDDSQTLIKIKVNEDITDFIEQGSIVENRDCMPEVILKNNKFLYAPNLRLSSSKTMRIEDNLFLEMLFPINITDNIGYWAESGRVNGVFIQNNRFIDCCRLSENYVVTVGRVPTLKGYSPDVRTHKNINIRNNYIENSGIMSAKYAQNIIVENNECCFSCEKLSKGNTHLSIKTDYCDNVVIKNNTVTIK